MVICFFLPPHVHDLRAKLTNGPIALEIYCEALKYSLVFREPASPGVEAPLPSAPLPGQDSHSGLNFPPVRRVSAGVMRYLAERDRELLSQGESTAVARPQTDTLSPNAILPSSPLLYLSAVGIKRENDWWRDGVNMAESPSDRRHAHSADKVEPWPTGEGLSGHKHGDTHIQPYR